MFAMFIEFKNKKVLKTIRNKRILLLLLIFFISPLATSSIRHVSANSRSEIAIEEKIFHINASRYEFMPRRLYVPFGVNVTLILHAEDTIHGFWLEGYNIKQTMCNEHDFVVNFITNKAGSFVYRCSEPACGPYHPYMNGVLQVESPAQKITPFIIIAFGFLFTMVSYGIYRKKNE